MKIRQADENNIAEIAAIEAECFSDPWPADMIARLLPRFTVALDEGGAVMGYLALSAVLDEGSIDNIAVAPAFRRRGVADALVADALARGRGTGLAFITARRTSRPSGCTKSTAFWRSGGAKTTTSAPARTPS